MKLANLCIENYRSIIGPRDIPLRDYTVLIGANNEGKSNVLHALALGMNALTSQIPHLGRPLVGRRRNRGSFRNDNIPRYRWELPQYDWDADFPIGKQSRSAGRGVTRLTLDFVLNTNEIAAFKQAIGVQLNGDLQIEVTLGRRILPAVRVLKRGPAGKILNDKIRGVMKFVNGRVRFQYIPAIRTAGAAMGVIESLVAQGLWSLRGDPDYDEALETMHNIRKPVLSELAGVIDKTVKHFVPRVKEVTLEITQHSLVDTLMGDVAISIDDGRYTRLERKGDGIKSLVALALLRHISEAKAPRTSTIFAIEEPEAHLHPAAIREIQRVIESLCDRHQVVLTTHSPQFVSHKHLESTIIVREDGLTVGPSKLQVRRSLGVQLSDNLHSAEVVLLVEGTTDEIALRSIISERSELLRKAFASDTVSIYALGGASKLGSMASMYLNTSCMVQCFLDDDNDGNCAIKLAKKKHGLRAADMNTCAVRELDEAELEDLYDIRLYGPEFEKKFGIDPRIRPPGFRRHKWSDRMCELCRLSGVEWEEMKQDAKYWLAMFATRQPDRIIRNEAVQPLIHFIKAAERKLGGKQ